jgi:hypothetical protein
VKDENGDQLAESKNIFNNRKNYFSQLLTVHNVSHVKQMKLYTTELIGYDPSPSEV